ncbi:penicillin epimerase [Pseudomonas marginalis ICMP 11289]|nr:penicillin epimerase [Pseudomonas marginalis ICMP 11289]
MAIDISRRSFINRTACLALAASTGSLFAADRGGMEAMLVNTVSSSDESYWLNIAAQYQVSPDITNLENGFYGIMNNTVLAEYHRNIKFLNLNNSYYMRTAYEADMLAVRAQIATIAGVLPEEIAITRGATEALQNLITNYNLIKPGDVVMYSDLDYDSAQYAMNYLHERRGANVVTLVIPEPASKQDILDTYAATFTANPKTKLLLLTHISHRTGRVMPVAEISAMAKAKGIDVIVDAAHSWGQMDFSIPDLNVDFAAFNLHKWMSAPLGVGFLYIRKGRLADIDRAYADEDFAATDIRSRVHSGTTNTANVMTVPTALALHISLGAANKQARLRFLRDYWVSRVREFKGMNILTSDEPGSYGAITSFRLTGKVSKADNVAITNELREKHNIFTVRRGGVAGGDCVRVSTAPFTKTSDLDRLVAALKTITKS